MKPAKKTPKQISPVDKTIASKEKLIVRLRKEISEVQKNCDLRVGEIEFRIKMAQTLLDALKRGK